MIPANIMQLDTAVESAFKEYKQLRGAVKAYLAHTQVAAAAGVTDSTEDAQAYMDVLQSFGAPVNTAHNAAKDVFTAEEPI